MVAFAGGLYSYAVVIHLSIYVVFISEKSYVLLYYALK